MKGITLAVAFLYSISCLAQQQVEKPYFDRTDLKIGYFGNVFFNNGISIGTEFAWRERSKAKDTKKGIRTTTKQMLLNGSVGYTSGIELSTENGILVSGGLTMRRTRPGGTQYSLEVNPVGYYRSLLGETYRVDGEDIDKVALAGRSYYNPSIAFGIGRQRKYKYVSGWYVNLRLSARLPYNSSVLPYASLEFGQRINFKKRSK